MRLSVLAFGRAWLTAAALSGVPSTIVATARDEDVLASTRVIGRVVLRSSADDWRATMVGVATHGAISLAWTAVARVVVTARADAVGDRIYRGALLGAAIAVVDLGVIGRHLPEVRDLAVVPQVADHLAFGALASI